MGCYTAQRFSDYSTINEGNIRTLENGQQVIDHLEKEPVDLLLGNSHGKQIAKAEGIPLVRAGFPVLDRYGHASLPIVGYRGAFQLATKIADTLMEEFDRNCADEDMDLIM